MLDAAATEAFAGLHEADADFVSGLPDSCQLNLHDLVEADTRIFRAHDRSRKAQPTGTRRT